MGKRRASVLIAVALAIAVMASAAYAADLSDASIYFTPSSDYKSGDCILSASKVMIRRAAIMNGSTAWSQVTNESIRGLATTNGLLLNEFKIEFDGLAYQVSSGSFSGKGEAARISEFEALIQAHPEGIVVHGTNAASSGTHGVLVTSVVNGVVFAADSSHNMGSSNKGIEKWSDTSMKKADKVTKYWYIKEISKGTGDSLVSTVADAIKGKSTLRVVSCRKPKTIKKGRIFNIKGKVKSNKNITAVTVQIRDLKGNVKYTATAEPNAKSYNIRKMDNLIRFSKLKRGKYYYTIVATDTEKTKTLLNKKFKIK